LNSFNICTLVNVGKGWTIRYCLFQYTFIHAACPKYKYIITLKLCRWIYCVTSTFSLTTERILCNCSHLPWPPISDGSSQIWCICNSMSICL
jgi:hypothetical protein